jgi:hypothetical protein
VRRSEAGQASIESAWLVAALALGVFGLGWNLVLRLIEAWLDHRQAVLSPLLSIWP